MLLQPRQHPRRHLARRLTARRPEPERIGGPVVDGGADVVEAAPLPVAEVDLLEAIVEARGAQCLGEQARARERTGVQCERFRQQRPQPRGYRGRGFGEAEVGLPVADAGRDVRAGVADEVQLHGFEGSRRRDQAVPR